MQKLYLEPLVKEGLDGLAAFLKQEEQEAKKKQAEEEIVGEKDLPVIGDFPNPGKETI